MLSLAISTVIRADQAAAAGTPQFMSIGAMSEVASAARSNLLFARLLPDLLTPEMAGPECLLIGAHYTRAERSPQPVPTTVLACSVPTTDTHLQRPGAFTFTPKRLSLVSPERGWAMQVKMEHFAVNDVASVTCLALRDGRRRAARRYRGRSVALRGHAGRGGGVSGARGQRRRPCRSG